MARRRMIDPNFWTDPEVNQCSYAGKILILGCMSNADDEGRIQAHPSLLKALIFIYDDEQTAATIRTLLEETLKRMESWHSDNPYIMRIYQNGNAEYLYFPSWVVIQRPSHPTPSRLPAPPSGGSPERLPNTSGNPPEVVQKPSALGQSSLGQSSIGKVSLVLEEDFSKINSKDLTDFLTETLEKYRPRGLPWLVEVLCKFWAQSIGEPMKQEVFTLTREAVKAYSSPVLARAYTKTVKYRGGKYGSWKYLDKVLKEQAEKGKG